LKVQNCQPRDQEESLKEQSKNEKKWGPVEEEKKEV